MGMGDVGGGRGANGTSGGVVGEASSYTGGARVGKERGPDLGEKPRSRHQSMARFPRVLNSLGLFYPEKHLHTPLYKSCKLDRKVEA